MTLQHSQSIHQFLVSYANLSRSFILRISSSVLLLSFHTSYISVCLNTAPFLSHVCLTSWPLFTNSHQVPFTPKLLSELVLVLCCIHIWNWLTPVVSCCCPHIAITLQCSSSKAATNLGCCERETAQSWAHIPTAPY